MSAVYPENHGRGGSRQSRRDRRRRQELFDAQKGCCHWCGGMMSMNALRPSNGPSKILKCNEAYATFEHLIPKSHGGNRGVANIVLAHAACNHKRAKLKWAHDPVYGKAIGSRMRTAHSLPFVKVEEIGEVTGREIGPALNTVRSERNGDQHHHLSANLEGQDN